MIPVNPPGMHPPGTHPAGRLPVIRRLVAAVTTATLVGVSGAFGGAPGIIPGPGTAHALPLPLAPDDPVVADTWVDPFARTDDQNHDVDIEVTGFNFTGALTLGEKLVVQVKVSNNTDDVLDQVTLLVQRQGAATSNVTARMALAADGLNNYPYYATQMVLDGTVSPGESTETTLRIPTDADESITLAITQPGTYPVRIALSGQLDGTATHLDSQRFLLPVSGEPVPGAEEPGGTPTTVLYPFTATTDVLGGETGEAPEAPPLLMGSDALAGELAAGGRLSMLIDAFLSSSPDVQRASCLAIDPELLNVIDRMAGGYTIAEERGSTARQNQRLRELWTTSNEPTNTTPGTGTTDASAFLEKLREAAATTCTVALPWSNTDLDAVTATGNQWLLREALQRGSTVLEDILGVPPVDNVVIPGSGYVSPATAANLGWADTTSQELTLEQAWEVDSVTPVPSSGRADQTALDAPASTRAGATAAPPREPVQVLVADNTVWATPSADRFHQLAPGITAVSYQGSLAATLATLGPSPETAGYSNPDSRFDFTLDSQAARTMTGQGAIRLTVDNGDADTPVLIMPPTTMAAEDAEMLLDTTADLFDTGAAEPFTLSGYLTANAQQREDLATATQVNGMPGETSFGAPFDDASAITDTEILRATQQATYIDDLTGIMYNDEGIVLTRYGFSAPLRQDLLRALTTSGRRSYTGHTTATRDAEQLLNQNRDALQKLRSSVALLPPGNVYTRTSSSSPLIIVAQNGLPLPSATQILYSAPGDAQVNTPGIVRIPARGSITLQMTADLPDDNQRTDLTVWLASADGATISDPVEISVQPRPNLVGTVGIVALGILVLGALLVFRVFRIRRKKGSAGDNARTAPHSAPRSAPPSATRTVARPMAPGNVGEGRRKASRYVPRGHGRADDGSGSPKPPGNN
ncbi:hypothetical protein CFAEC_13555 [Corynebacterium faecale]|nr:hypothetical protein CFAEC_13555 [Corynebacterium faecale]